ncbi:hypothetical protein BH23PLA1_BH23PLA1_37710 [soil metagenome]
MTSSLVPGNVIPRIARRRGRVVLVLALALMALALAHRPLLVGFAHGFRVDDPAPADALVLLLGGERDRAEKVAELYHCGLAPMVLMGDDPDLDMNRAFLIEGKVPAEALRSLGPTVGTFEEAQRVKVYAEAHGLRRVTVVTTAFHTARARWTFERALRGTGVEVRTAASRDPRFDENNWYKTEAGRLAYRREAIKAIYYRLVY